jgi:hypothetical protein
VAAFSHSGGVVIYFRPFWRGRDGPRGRGFYRGRATADALATLPHGERDTAFAQAWSEHEARLKCLGLQLSEWRDDLALALRTCRNFSLALPEGHVGYLALTGVSGA